MLLSAGDYFFSFLPWQFYLINAIRITAQLRPVLQVTLI